MQRRLYCQYYTYAQEHVLPIQFSCMYKQYFLAFQLFNHVAPVVQTLDSAIHRINLYPADSVIDFCNTYPLDSDLSGG